MRSFARICVLQILLVIIDAGSAAGAMQESSLPYEETFDAVVPPALPAGWTSSASRVPGAADFTTVSGSPASPPHAVMASNGTVEQWLASPSLDCSGVRPDRIRFSVRRSSTFTARCVVEASLDGGLTYGTVIGEAPGAAVSSSYVQADLELPGVLAGKSQVVFRWHILPEATGTTGTFRMDDVRITVSRPEAEPGMVVVNEIQFQPAPNEPEWIELYNNGPDAVDLREWTLSDMSETSMHQITNRICMVQPEDFAIVAADSAAFRVQWPDCPATILQPDGFPSLNNSGDRVLLRDFGGRAIDSIWYRQEWGGGAGVSLERIDPLSHSPDGNGWGSCLDPSGTTPGRINSIVIQENDLRAGDLTLASSMLPDFVVLRLIVHNAGRLPAGQFTVRVLSGFSRDSVATGDSMVISSFIGTPVPSRDSLSVDLHWDRPRPGTHRLRAEIDWAPDQRTGNNSCTATVSLPIPHGTIRISEIMSSPVGGTAEYVELVNSGTDAIDLSGCWIEDRRLPSGSVNRWLVTTNSTLVGTGGFHVVAGDSSVLQWPGGVPSGCSVVNSTGLGLNNDEDCVVLFGPDSGMVDSVAYSSSWHSASVPDPTGRSLERYHADLPGNDPRNWGSCVHPSGGTPGRANSIAVDALPGYAALTSLPDPFSPDGDGRDDVTVIRYQLPMRSALVRIKVFDIRGRCVRDLANADPVSAAGEVVWDGYDNNRKSLRIGIYILYVEAIVERGGSVVTAKKTVVLARKL